MKGEVKMESAQRQGESSLKLKGGRRQNSNM